MTTDNVLPPCEHCQFEDKPSPNGFHIIRWHEAECTAEVAGTTK